MNKMQSESAAVKEFNLPHNSQIMERYNSLSKIVNEKGLNIAGSVYHRAQIEKAKQDLGIPESFIELALLDKLPLNEHSTVPVEKMTADQSGQDQERAMPASSVQQPNTGGAQGEQERGVETYQEDMQIEKLEAEVAELEGSTIAANQLTYAGASSPVL